MTDTLRTRIAAALDRHKTDPYDEWTCQCNSTGIRWADHAADAVIRDVLTPEFLADMMIAAVKKAADDERRIKAEQAAAFHSRGSNLLHTKGDNEQT